MLFHYEQLNVFLSSFNFIEFYKIRLNFIHPGGSAWRRLLNIATT